jgi:shikimate kinase
MQPRDPDPEVDPRYRCCLHVRVVQLVVITGPIGSGKSSVARGLAERFDSAGWSVACVDLDDVVETLSAPLQDFETSWQRARRVHGALVGAWLRSGIDAVIAHGPFYTAEETTALLAEVPPSQEQRRVMLLAPFEVALQRVAHEPDRFWSRDPGVLRRTHERFNALLSEIPECEWTFDTTRISVDEIVSVLAGSLVPDRAGAERTDSQGAEAT